MTALPGSPEMPNDLPNFEDANRQVRNGSDGETEQLSPPKKPSFFSLPVADQPIVNYDKLGSSNNIGNFFDEHQITMQDLARDNLYFRTRIWALEQEVVDHERRNRLLSSYQAGHHVGSEVDKLQERIEKQDREITSLKQQSRSRDIFRELLPTIAAGQTSILRGRLATHHTQLTRAVEVLGSLDSFEFLPHKLFSSQHSDLASLVNRAFAEPELQQLLIERSPCSQTILQALVGAAVCEWVFLDRIQWMATFSSPLVEVYRRHISAIRMFPSTTSGRSNY
jgi:glycine cleavage system regulatory protein